MINRMIWITIAAGLTLFLMRAMSADVSYAATDIVTLSVISGLFFILYLRLARKPLRIGELAAKKGLLTLAESKRILECQGNCDDRFGEIAVRENFITETQLERLLTETGSS
jgi:hypothetical protein